MKHDNWNGFKEGVWQNEINVRDFIQQNYKPYEGDDSFLAGATERTTALMNKLQGLFALEREYGGVLAVAPKEPTTEYKHKTDGECAPR